MLRLLVFFSQNVLFFAGTHTGHVVFPVFKEKRFFLLRSCQGLLVCIPVGSVRSQRRDGLWMTGGQTLRPRRWFLKVSAGHLRLSELRFSLAFLYRARMLSRKMKGGQVKSDWWGRLYCFVPKPACINIKMEVAHTHTLLFKSLGSLLFLNKKHSLFSIKINESEIQTLVMW